MHKYNIGDIVKVKSDEEFLFIVADVMDFTKTAEVGKKTIIDVDYELIQIFPVLARLKYITFSQNDIILHSRYGTVNHELALKFVKKTRDKMGLKGEPEFLKIVNRNIIDSDKAVEPKDLDIVRYDMIKTIDECLDAINDLTILHKMFGDEAYLQLIEVVGKRIIKLNK